MTQKSKSQLDALIVTNSTGAITPAIIRDFVDSAVNSHGSLYVTSSSATTITTPGTYYKMAGTTASVALHRFTSPTNNRLTYTGTVTSNFHIVINISVLSAGNNQVVGFAVAKNGTTLAHSIMETKVLTGSDIDVIAIHADTTLATNDYIELWCTNSTSTSTVTAEHAYMYAMGHLRDDVADV